MALRPTGYTWWGSDGRLETIYVVTLVTCLAALFLIYPRYLLSMRRSTCGVKIVLVLDLASTCLL